MYSTTMRKLLTVLLATIACAGARQLYAQTGGLTGTAKDEKGNILVRYPIVIERQEIKGVYKTKTDKHGKYIYIGLPIGNYKVTLQDPSGKTLFYISHHVGMGDPTEIDFDLAKERAREEQANPEAVKKMQEQQADQKQYTGLKQLYDGGTALMAQGKFADAASMYEKAIPLAKGNNLTVLYSQTAQAYEKAHQYDKAIDYFQKAITADPTNANLLNSLGNTYAEMGKLPEAEQEFQKSAQLDPAHAAMAYYNLGAVLTNSGKMDEAAAAFKKATDIDPQYADAYFLEAQALMGKATMDANGKVVPAPGTIEALENYLKVDPNGKYAAAAQQMIQNLTGEIQTSFEKKKKKR